MTGVRRRVALTARLSATAARLVDDRVRVLVIGEFKQGKSLLVSALVRARVCPVDDDIATSVPTAVCWAEKPSVTLVKEQPRRGEGPGGESHHGATSDDRAPVMEPTEVPF